jgi:colanic acid/amylovoran biosynthesis glycosyltransferase
LSRKVLRGEVYAARKIGKRYKRDIVMNLILFTETFPYDGAFEQTFLSQEIGYLVEGFDRVIIVPGRCEGIRCSLPQGVIVEEGYSSATWPKGQILKAAILSPLLYTELMSHLFLFRYPNVVKRLIMFSGRAELTHEWIGQLLEKYSFDSSQCIFYTYWFDLCTTGISLARKENPRLVLITRAHGYDVYEERHRPAYILGRKFTLGLIDHLFVVSEAGVRYISCRYPENKECEIARLGVVDPGFVSLPSRDNVFRIVSCSMLVQVKRVALLLEGIAEAARLRPFLSIEWTHFGGGPLMPELVDKAAAKLPSNVRYHLLGTVAQSQVMDHYRLNAVDVFVNVSEYEGVPVSIMEAVSCGIPVIATAVGGNPEIVSARNGVLLSAYPTPEEIAHAILYHLDNPEEATRRRTASRKVWEENYNADVNYPAFVRRISEVRDAV